MAKRTKSSTAEEISTAAALGTPPPEAAPPPPAPNPRGSQAACRVGDIVAVFDPQRGRSELPRVGIVLEHGSGPGAVNLKVFGRPKLDFPLFGEVVMLDIPFIDNKGIGGKEPTAACATRMPD